MKRYCINCILFLLTASLFINCASGTSTVPVAREQQVQQFRTVIVDWKNRSTGVSDIPEWIQSIALDNFDEAARILGFQAGGQGAPIYRGFITRGRNLQSAGLDMDVTLVRKIENELRTSLDIFLGSDVNHMSASQSEVIHDISQVQGFTITGMRIIGDFWQVVDVIDGDSIARETILYRLYMFEADTWAVITAGFVENLLNGIPQHMQPGENEVMEMLRHILTQSRIRENF